MGIEDDEAKNMTLAMQKTRLVHTNCHKIKLRVTEEVTKNPKSAAHGEVIKQLQTSLISLQKLCQDYEQIITTGKIPDLGEPTTANLLRKKSWRTHWGIPPPKKTAKIKNLT